MMTRSRLGLVVSAALASSWVGAAPARPPGSWCGSSDESAFAAILAHREQVARRGQVRLASIAGSTDVGDVAVLLDAGDLALFQNRVDLVSVGLVLTPSGDGFRVSRVDSAVSPDAGSTLPLGDDDTRRNPLPFGFPFYGTTYQDLYVSSDGNLTFGAGDSASTDRDLSRLVSGPPRIAPLLTDLDPTAGGTVRILEEADRFTVTWTDVPRWGERDRNTFRVTLKPDGSIELAWGEGLGSALTGVVGVAPGSGGGPLVGIDVSEAAGEEGRALAEAFRPEDELDIVATARRFIATHSDDFHQLVVFTTQRLTERGTLAFQSTVRNPIRGIGVGQLDQSAQFGSAGRLESFVMMDHVTKYPQDPAEVGFPPDSTLSVLAHETGHRWLARVEFMDGTTRRDDLLGRQSAHWSFFMNSVGSYLEGNEIEDLGNGHFQTVAASVRYSPLDQYLMGIRAPEEVPDFFYVSRVSGTGIDDKGANPLVGVGFDGVRNDVSVADVIAAEGARDPAPGPPLEPWRQAFVLVAIGGPPGEDVVAHVERIREAWPAYFAASVDGRWAVRTELR